MKNNDLETIMSQFDVILDNIFTNYKVGGLAVVNGEKAIDDDTIEECYHYTVEDLIGHYRIYVLAKTGIISNEEAKKLEKLYQKYLDTKTCLAFEESKLRQDKHYKSKNKESMEASLEEIKGILNTFDILNVPYSKMVEAYYLNEFVKSPTIDDTNKKQK